MGIPFAFSVTGAREQPLAPSAQTRETFVDRLDACLNLFGLRHAAPPNGDSRCSESARRIARNGRRRIPPDARAEVAPAGRRESAKGALWRFWRNACAPLADRGRAMSTFDCDRDVPGGGHARASGGCYHLSFRSGSRSRGSCARAAHAYITRTEEYDGGDRDDAVYTESGHM